MDVLESNRIIKEIHKSFIDMESLITKKLDRDIAKAYSQEDISINQKVVDKGFANASSNKIFTQDYLLKAEELNDRINEYSVKYPTYKFITDKKIMEVCEKYNLIIAPPQSYIGEIPDKCAKDIAEFKDHHPNDMMEFYDKDDVNKFVANANELQHYNVAKKRLRLGLRAMISLIRDKVLNDWESSHLIRMINENYPKLVNLPLLTARSSMFIAATEDLLDLKGYKVKDNKMILDLSYDFKTPEMDVPDPIVFSKVPGGAIIITAWGEEAEDGEIKHSELLN